MKITVNYDRDGLIEKQSVGYYERYLNKNDEKNDYPYYLRSCAKPLQASLMIDYEINRIFNLTSEEIALCCASHAGEPVHTKIAETLLKKFDLDILDVKCGLHKPISEYARNLLLLKGEDENIFHNNCVGKHLLFLAICKVKNWDVKTYYLLDSPLQIKVKEKINSLCHVEKNYPVTTDGCGVPILSMPLNNILNGYIKLFTSKKYEPILEAYRNNPYIIGGEKRLDTEIMTSCKNLVAKVGAGGLCVVVNPEIEDAFIVKINDADMESRRYAVLNIINNLGWGKMDFDDGIYTLHGQKVGKININYD